MKNLLIVLWFVVVGLCFSSCSKEEVRVSRSNGFDSFVANYNVYIAEWLEEQVAGLGSQREKSEKELAEASDEGEKAAIRKELENIAQSLEKYQNRIEMKEYFSFKTLDDLPGDLVWENGMDNPEIGDPRAKKGGIMHDYIPDFPRTLRPIGDLSNTSFRGEIYDNIDMGLVGYHPITKEFFPGLACEWALGDDGRTVYYRLDEEASYSDGVKVKAKDFIFGMFIRLSDNITDPYSKQYYREQFANFTVYSDRVLSISLPEVKPKLPLFAGAEPAPPHFYAEYGPDYEERYQWRVPPTTGAYTVLPEDIKKGRSVTLTRVKDWWAKDRKFYRYSNNVDKISYQVIAEESKAFELFRLGKLDFMLLGSPEKWYDKMEIDEYFDGYIAKTQFYNVYPRIPRGFYLNVDRAPLDDVNIRRGFGYALNFDKVNTILFYGDAERLEQFSDGFQEYTNPKVKAREFSISKAQECFAKAGYDRTDRDGYLMNKDGKRLQIEISWTKYPIYDRMMALLREEAKKAGLELLLDGQQQSVNYKKVLEKRHQAAFSGWGVSPPFPRYFQFFHSTNAFDKKGNIKTGTNNINSYSNARMDRLCEIVRGARTDEELISASYEVQQLVHDDAIFIPGLKTAYIRLGYWNWLRFPETKLYEFSTPQVYIPTESYLYWIDEDLKRETLEARRNGEVLSEKNNLYDLYRDGVPTLSELEQRDLTKP